MSDRRFGSWLSLIRQGLSVEREFGTHSLEALLSMAELVEQSVYERGSLARTATGLTFRLNNPPLRTGGFSAVRAFVDQVPLPSTRAQFRPGAGFPWRSASDVSVDRSLELRPGVPTEILLETAVAAGTKKVTVRLELESIAIPPLVWLEFTDEMNEGKTP